MHIAPRYNNLVVERLDAEEQKTESGLIIKTEDRTQTIFEALIIAVGPESDLWPEMRVLFDGRGSQKIKDPKTGDEYLLLKDEQVVAVVND